MLIIISLWVATFSGLSIQQPEYQVPKPIQSILNHRFPGWTITPYTIPPNCLAREDVVLSPYVKSYYECDLNGDNQPDYAFRLATKIDSLLYEFFIVVLSAKNTFETIVLDSSSALAGAHNRYLWKIPAGKQITIFDHEDWTLITKFGVLSEDGNSITFPVDALMIEPICEAYYKEVQVGTYVYIRDRFYCFSSAD